MDKINTDIFTCTNHFIFNCRDLILVKDQRRRKIYNTYNDLYIKCLNQIKYKNSISKTDCIYIIPSIIFGDMDYNSIDCLNFIEYKLKISKFDTLKINQTSIFISWKYLELYLQ